MGLLFHYFIYLFIRTICTIFEDANSSIPNSFIPASLRQDIGDLLSRLAIQPEPGHPFNGGNIGDISNETILAWIGATESGNSTARENLQRLQQQFIANASDQACGFHFLLLITFLTILFFLSLATFSSGSTGAEPTHPNFHIHYNSAPRSLTGIDSSHTPFGGPPPS